MFFGRFSELPVQSFHKYYSVMQRQHCPLQVKCLRVFCLRIWRNVGDVEVVEGFTGSQVATYCQVLLVGFFGQHFTRRTSKKSQQHYNQKRNLRSLRKIKPKGLERVTERVGNLSILDDRSHQKRAHMFIWCAREKYLPLRDST